MALSSEVTARKELCPLMFVFVSCCRHRLQGITCEYSTDIDEVALECLCHLKYHNSNDIEVSITVKVKLFMTNDEHLAVAID